jgi:hypothetical protein
MGGGEFGKLADGFLKNFKHEIVLVAEIHIVVEAEAVRGFPKLECLLRFSRVVESRSTSAAFNSGARESACVRAR